MKQIVAGILVLAPALLHAQQPAPSPPPIRLGGDVVLRSLLVRVDPEYPALAQAARMADHVMVDVLIDKEGKVTPRGVRSGHPLLNDAALRAVEQWQFAPIVILFGPADVVAAVPVRFSPSPPSDAARLPAGSAVLSGQIRHADGRPISNAFVLASVTGVETPAVSMLVPADSTGAYRITNLPPGMYHVQAGTAMGSATYYPGVASPNAALAVSIAPGQATVERIDFTIP